MMIEIKKGQVYKRKQDGEIAIVSRTESDLIVVFIRRDGTLEGTQAIRWTEAFLDEYTLDEKSSDRYRNLIT